MTFWLALVLTTAVSDAGGASGKYGVYIGIENNLCEDLVYTPYLSISPWWQSCNNNKQETWQYMNSYGPSTVAAMDGAAIEFQGHMNVGVEGVIQWFVHDGIK